jgi:uncharacterized membrane protein
MARVKPVHAAAACVAYPVFCHVAVVTADARWAALGIAAVAWALLSAGRRASRAALIAAFALAGALAAALTVPPALLIHAPPVALHVALSALFGATLLGGREPMVTRFARAEHGGSLPQDLQRYTRALTFLWSAFFAAMAAASASLALWGSATAWSLFTNLFSYLAVAGVFSAEYAYRRLRYRHHRHLSPADIVRRLHTYRVLSR